MKKPYPCFCNDCKYSKPEINSEWNLKCHHPEVNADDAWALSNSFKSGGGSDCSKQRQEVGWFTPCGKSGKLWEAKD
jgi:hypothetical protein